MKNNPAFTVV